MTVILSIATPSFVGVAADSTVTVTFPEGPDRVVREPGRKLKVLDKAFVARWGDLTGDPIFRLLQSLPQSISADELVAKIADHLAHTDRPGDHDVGHLGYHVGGLGADGAMLLRNVTWEPAGTLPQTPSTGNYGNYPHSANEGISLLYNGRNDLAEKAVSNLIDELRAGRPSRFSLSTPEGALRFADFVVRYASELTPDVGPPISLAAIARNGSTFRYFHKYLRPLPREFDRQVQRALRDAG